MSSEIQAMYAVFEGNDVDLADALAEMEDAELKWFADKLDVLIEAVDRRLDPAAFDVAPRDAEVTA